LGIDPLSSTSQNEVAINTRPRIVALFWVVVVPAISYKALCQVGVRLVAPPLATAMSFAAAWAIYRELHVENVEVLIVDVGGVHVVEHPYGKEELLERFEKASQLNDYLEQGRAYALLKEGLEVIGESEKAEQIAPIVAVVQLYDRCDALLLNPQVEPEQVYQMADLWAKMDRTSLPHHVIGLIETALESLRGAAGQRHLKRLAEAERTLFWMEAGRRGKRYDRVKEDGDCWATALAAAAQIEIPPAKARARVAHYLREYEAQYGAVVADLLAAAAKGCPGYPDELFEEVEGESDYERYCRCVETTHMFGSNLEIEAWARVFNCHVTVWRVEEDEHGIFQLASEKIGPVGRKRIDIAHLGGNGHYNPFIVSSRKRAFVGQSPVASLEQ